MPPPKIPSDLAPLLALGWGIAVWITGGVLLGHWADNLWGWQPWGTLGGALIGITGSGFTVLRVTRQLERSDNAKSDESVRERDKTT
jgi:F0F1-type ATP synthase assembly protein I